MISHRHGIDAGLHPDEDAARAAVAAYARQWWHEIAGQDGQAAPGVAVPPPAGDDEAIAAYFDQARESYTIIPVNMAVRVTPACAARLGRARAGGPSEEYVLLLANDCTIRTDTYAGNPAGSSYVRVCDPGGQETGYWAAAEWAEDPELVMAAILGAARPPS